MKYVLRYKKEFASRVKDLIGKQLLTDDTLKQHLLGLLEYLETRDKSPSLRRIGYPVRIKHMGIRDYRKHVLIYYFTPEFTIGIVAVDYYIGNSTIIVVPVDIELRYS